MKNNLINEIINYDNFGLGSSIKSILPNPDRILRSGERSYSLLRDLKSDPHVWSCIQSRKSGLLALEWTLIPNNVNSEIFNIIEIFIKSLDLNSLTRDILEAPLFGYQPFEVVWKLENSKYKLLLPDKIIPKPQEWFRFNKDQKIILNKYNNSNIEIPDYKIITASYEGSYINPYGHSLLSKCYYPVSFKNGGLKFWLNFIEKFGSPIVLGQYQRGSTQSEIEKFAESLNEMAQDAVIVAPSDINLEFKEAAKNGSSILFKDLLKFCNNEISKAILSQTLTTEVDMGSYAATEIHYKVRKEVILSDARIVESFMNQLIKWIIEINFPKSAQPIFNLIINDAENTQRIERDIRISQLGFKFTKEYLINTYGYKEMDLYIGN
jgi:phage gp29-like protein